jgi:preprotein translocase subunit SecY
MCSIFTHCSCTRPVSHPSYQARKHCISYAPRAQFFSCSQRKHRHQTLWCASRQRSADYSEDWQDFAPLGIVTRRLLVNVCALFCLVLAEAVPLCCADPTALPHGTLQLLKSTSLASYGTIELLHPFMLGIAPFVEAMIFCQMIGTLYGWDKLPVPARFKLSVTQTQTPYGRTAIMFMSAFIGACLATGFALVAANHFIGSGVVGHAQLWDITAALVAGSAIMYKLSELITEFGLGQGISFIYMVSIASSAQSTAVCVLTLADSSRLPTPHVLLASPATL